MGAEKVTDGKVIPLPVKPQEVELTPEQRIQKNKKSILRAMKRIGGATAEGNYDGAGDSGQINNVTIYDEKYKPIEKRTSIWFLKSCGYYHPKENGDGYEFKGKTVREKLSLEDAIEEFMYDYIEMNYSGYENNDGGGGSVEFDVETEECKWNHYWNVTESDGERLI